MYRVKLKGIFLLILATAFSLSIMLLSDTANAGQPIPNVSQTATESPVLVGYWDLRDRESYFQVTNTTGDNQRVHIQIYDAGNNCVEFNYYDTLTPRDTHVYNVADLDRNNGVELAAPDLSEGHGIIAITHVDEIDDLDVDAVLTGNFRINDSEGYRYQTNLAGLNFIDFIGSYPTVEYFDVNFNNINNSMLADLVVINAHLDYSPGGIFPFDQEYEVALYDEEENLISCNPVELGCFPDSESHLINVGINQAITNSREGPSLCLGNDLKGYIELAPEEDFDQFDFQVVFLGLNNGDGIGSMTDGTIVGTENVNVTQPTPAPPG